MVYFDLGIHTLDFNFPMMLAKNSILPLIPACATMFVGMLLILLPLQAGSWCSPLDTGECAIKIRTGKSTSDADYRSIHFLNHKHSPSGIIRVQPTKRRMEFIVLPKNSPVGTELAPQLTVSDQGVVAEAGIHVRGSAVFDGSLSCPHVKVSKVEAENVISSSLSSQNISVERKLQSQVIVAKEQLRSMSTVLSSSDEKPTRGAYLDPLGSVEIYSEAKDAHVDLKSNIEEDFSVRALQSTASNGLLLHGQRVLITAAGKVGIGVDLPTHSMHVNGRVRATSATITTGSDRRIKKNIRDVDPREAFLRIKKLRVRHYDFHPAYANSEGISEHRRSNRTGFIAQELAEVFPEAVEEIRGVKMFGEAPGKEEVDVNFPVNPEVNKSSLQVDNLLTVDLEPVLFDLIATVQHLQAELERTKKQCGRCMRNHAP